MIHSGRRRRQLRTCQVYKDAQKQWRWRLVAANGNIVADSGEGYRRRADAVHMAERILTPRHLRWEGL